MTLSVSVQQANVVILKYDDLIQGVDVCKQIEEAYGFDGLGILCVSGIPGLVESREHLLPLARQFALLSDEVKSRYIHHESMYSFGWSHGKEKLQGKPDHSKGSYYANPQYDRPVDDEKLIAKYASFIHPNIWPKDELPELEYAFKTLGQIIVNAGKFVSKHCDRYVVSKNPAYISNRLESIVDTSLCCKARLLHYFPYDGSSSSSGSSSSNSSHDNSNCDSSSSSSSDSSKGDDDFSSWCGWHNDHGSITGLVSAMFIDADGNQVSNSDPNAGLYIRSRNGQLYKVNIPSDCVAYQIGETAQIHSGGVLQATPHAVRGSSIANVSRETFAVFMEPMWMEPMTCPDGVDPKDAQSNTAAVNLPKGVPSLSSRWNPNQTFGDFTDVTLSSYY